MREKITAGLLLVAIIAVTVVFVKSFVADKVAEANEKSQLALDAKVAEQELLLSKISELTRTNGADEITEKIIVDCTATERARFDALLDQLSGSISGQEIKELDTLFYKCARFYADRKSVMAARLHREVEVYEEYVRLYGYIRNEVSVDLEKRVVVWRQVADSELTLAGYFNDLVRLQGNIITALLQGQSKESTDIKNTLSEVAITRDKMTMLTKQLENLQLELRAI